MEDKELVERLEARNKAYIDFLTDVNADRRRGSIVKDVIIFVLIFVNILLVCGLVWVALHCQDKMDAQADRSEARMYEFLSEYDFDTSYNLDTGTIVNSDSSGNISFRQEK